MAEDQNKQEIIDYRIGLLVLKDQAFFDLSIATEELRKIRIQRQTEPVPNANPFLKAETSYLNDCVIDTVNKELELLEPKVWIGASEESKKIIYSKVTDFVMDKITNSTEPIDIFIALSSVGAVDEAAKQFLGING